MSARLLPFVLGAALGGIAGAMFPLHAEVDTPPPRAPEPPVAIAAEDTRWPCAAPPPARSDELDTLAWAWSTEWASFTEVWGAPMLEPAGWDRLADEDRFLRRLRSLQADFVDVDCTFYPCVGLAAFRLANEEDETDLEAVAETLGVSIEDLHFGELFDEDTTLEIGMISFAHPTTDLERLWALRRADRLQEQIQDELLELLE